MSGRGITYHPVTGFTIRGQDVFLLLRWSIGSGENVSARIRITVNKPEHKEKPKIEATANAGQDWPDGTGMIYLGMSPWEGMWKNRHQLMWRFSEQMPVLYVEPPQRLRRLRRQMLSDRKFWLEPRRPAIRKLKDQLFSYRSPNRFAVSGAKGLQYITNIRWLKAVRRAAGKIGISKPILWLSLPENFRALGRFGERMSIYHVVDEYEGYTASKENRRFDIRQVEKNLLDGVDLTIVVSAELLESKSGPGRTVRLVENAVDIRVFSGARHRASLPPDLAAIAKPRLGYSGLIGSRLDLGLISRVARSRADWSIVMIGKVDPRGCQSELDELKSLENVYFLGEKSPEMVPDYVAGLDLGLLPYVLNTETRHISPLKMFEYLAVGIPVVSTDIPAAHRKSGVVLVADTPENFVQVCEDLLSDKNNERVTARIEEAAANTWDHRVDQIAGLVLDHLQLSRN